MMRAILVCATLSWVTVLAHKCIPIDFGMGSTVCQCNSTYCDFYPDPKPPSKGEFLWYETSKSGLRLDHKYGNFSKEMPKHDIVITIDGHKKFQKMIGFGGAFTDSSGLNMRKLSEGCQENILRSYFSKIGSRYNLGRVPIGGTDFSTRGYTYDDVAGDIFLRNFSLAKEDTEFKIPFMHAARKLNPNLRFLSSPWTAPAWMKSNKQLTGFGMLLYKYYQTYADYIVKFLDSYREEGLEMWAVTTGNEPSTSLVPITRINTMTWTTVTIADWLLQNFIPTLANSQSNKTQILVLDDQRFNLPWYVIKLKKHSPKVLKYISGIAVHWYFDDLIPADVLDMTHAATPDKFILMTEACLGFHKWEKQKVILGSWDRLEHLVTKMFENINHWVTGWLDWNLALDLTGGPNWVDNQVDAPIIVMPHLDVFLKQPLFYALAHFSKFVPRGSFRVNAVNENEGILSTAFTKSNKTIVLLYNYYNKKMPVSILDKRIGSINLELLGKSLHTIIYYSKP